MTQPNGPSAPGRFVLLALVFEGGLGVLAWLLGMLLTRQPLERINFSAQAAAWGVLATGPLLFVLVLGRRYRVGPLKDINEAVEEVVLPLVAGARWTDLALVSLAAGIGEELLFRGVVQEAILWRFQSPWLAIIATSVGFGLLHPLNVAYGVLVGLIGAYLGALAYFTDGLAAPIITHGLYDFLALLYFQRGQSAKP